MAYTYLGILEEALDQPVGLEVQCQNAFNLRTRLYGMRQQEQKNGNNAYDNLACFETPDGHLWLVHHAALEQAKRDAGYDI
jgi:hypothetical protein